MASQRKSQEKAPARSLQQLSSVADLVSAPSSEEDKIKEMMRQSAHVARYTPYKKPPSSYICMWCGAEGHHHSRDCGQKKAGYKHKPARRAHGIPRSSLIKVSGPQVPGAMMTADGDYAVPVLHAEAYLYGKKPTLPSASSTVNHDKKSQESTKELPDFVKCGACNELITDCVIVACCGNSGCSDCVYEAITESEDNSCPLCNEPNQTMDKIIINRNMRVLCNRYR